MGTSVLAVWLCVCVCVCECMCVCVCMIRVCARVVTLDHASLGGCVGGGNQHWQILISCSQFVVHISILTKSQPFRRTCRLLAMGDHSPLNVHVTHVLELSTSLLFSLSFFRFLSLSFLSFRFLSVSLYLLDPWTAQVGVVLNLDWAAVAGLRR